MKINKTSQNLGGAIWVNSLPLWKRGGMMGQLSAYRFPESSGWEKILSWTLSDDFSGYSPNYRKYKIPSETWNYDIYLICQYNILAVHDVINSQSHLCIYLSNNNTESFNYATDMVLYSRTFYNSTANKKVAPDSFTIALDIKTNISYLSDDNNVLFNSLNFKMSDMNYISIWNINSGVKVGATIDFYGMNLPK